ncbi:uncharacterized protein RCC_05758 [Ramularia collo-cygni]|uniref:SWR1-complex protein 5 n=1 Tax=Ramularia collo-cygni TaxID=112498 RepID=A0A2D3URS6_9PEZI|nr:uncharacterized protein RCC_05758 [Ramularia collo-cygni]CZT19902.1 uncharacterized protein RCC_05758 [Ramularia collo-cygni]
MDEYMEDVDAREDEEQEEEYDENADEDFNPDKATEDPAGSSSSEDEDEAAVAKPLRKTKKRKSEVPLDEDLDSGDEATIKALARKKRKKQDVEDEDSAGEGGFIRTRAQRVAEKEERKHRKRARDGEVTVDVDQLWAELSSVPVGRTVLPPPEPVDEDMEVDVDQDKENAPEASSEEMITIRRRIEYAGEVTEVEDRVPRGSKEAQKYLAEHPEADGDMKQLAADPSGVQRPLKRPSMFEPNPGGLVKGVAPEKLRPRAPSRLDVLMATKRAEDKKNAQKMSTVQKSALDWRGYVDQEGLREELDEYGKSRGGFLAREAFLDRAAGAREQAARDARLKL